jgi:hypothetical protein
MMAGLARVSGMPSSLRAETTLARAKPGDRDQHGEERDRRAERGMNAAPPSVDRVLGGPGNPLDAGAREHFEQRFGHDFSRVRVHAGPAAAQSARDIDADAYTAGWDIVFGAGQYAPETSAGRRVLAHELTHVVQQAGRLVHRSLLVGAPDDAYEHEAARVADDAALSPERAQARSLPATLNPVLSGVGASMALKSAIGSPSGHRSRATKRGGRPPSRGSSAISRFSLPTVLPHRSPSAQRRSQTRSVITPRSSAPPHRA